MGSTSPVDASRQEDPDANPRAGALQGQVLQLRSFYSITAAMLPRMLISRPLSAPWEA